MTTLTSALLVVTSTARAQTNLFKDDFSGPKLSDWQPSMSIAISQSNQQFVATGTFTGPMQTNNPSESVGDGFHPIPTSGPLPDNQTLEARVDLVSANQKDVQADLHFWGEPEAAGYGVFKSDRGIGLLKFWSWASGWAWFFYDERLLKHQNVTLVLALTRRGSNLEINTRVLDKDHGNTVLFSRTVTDTPQPDTVLPSGSVNGGRSMCPVNVPTDLTNAVAVAAGSGAFETYGLALRADGNVLVWGLTNTPSAAGLTNTVGLTNVVAIAGGSAHCLALLSDGPPILQASLKNAKVTPAGFSVSVPTQSGRVYALEYKHSLTDSPWIPLPLVAGTGHDQTLTDSTANGTQRFYRVRRW